MGKKTLILLITLIILTGCVGKLKSYNSLSEDEVIEYVKNTIYKELGDEVEVKITWKQQKYLCDANIDNSCFGKHEIPNTYFYKLTITNKNNPEISAEDNYFTDSYKENDTIIERKFDYKKYKKEFVKNKFINDIKRRLQGIKYEVKSNQIYIFSKNYEYIHRQLFSYVLNIDYIYDNKQPLISYDIYVIKDEEVFNKLQKSNFVYKSILKNAKNIKNTYGYARNFMEIEKADNYKYVFFRYSSDGCVGSRNCSIVYGIN